MPHEFSFEEIYSNEIFYLKEPDGKKIVYLHPGSIHNVACTLCKKTMSISMFEKHYRENLKTSVRCARWLEYVEWKEERQAQAEELVEEQIPKVFEAEEKSDDDDSEDTDSSAPITELRKKKSSDKKRSTLKDKARKVQLKKKKLNSGESKTVVVVPRPKSPSTAVASVELSKTPPTAIVPTAAPVPAPDRMTTQEMFADTSDDDTVNKNSAIAEDENEQDDEDIYADGEFTELSQKVSDNFPGFLEDLKCPKAGAELTTCLENANDPFSVISSKTKMKLLPYDEYIDFFDFYMTQLIGFGPNTKNFLTSIFIHVLSVNVNDMPVVDYIHSGRLDTAEKRSLAIRKCFIFEYNKDDAPALEVRNKFLSGELPITWDKPKVIQALWQLKSKWASLVVGFAFPKTNVRGRKKG